MLIDTYALVKTLHILSAAVLFGTGLGIAFFMFVGLQSRDLAQRLLSARFTVTADFCFTLPAVIIQPLSGAYLVWKSGISWNASWLLWAYGLFAFTGLCWIPVVFIQMQLRDNLQNRQAHIEGADAEFNRLFDLWFWLGWPAFASVIVIFWLMVAKPA